MGVISNVEEKIFKNELPLKKRSKFRIFWDILSDILMVPIFFVIFCCAVSIFNARNQCVVPTLFDYSAVKVLTGSMVRSGFEIDECTLIKKANPAGLKRGDVIAYYRNDAADDGFIVQTNNGTLAQSYTTPNNVSKYANFQWQSLFGYQTSEIQLAGRAGCPIIFHKILDIKQDASGKLWFKTFGTSNIPAGLDEDDVTLSSPGVDGWWVDSNYIVGTYVDSLGGTIVSFLLNFLNTSSGVVLLILVPIILVLVLLGKELLNVIYVMGLQEKILSGKMLLSDPVAIKWKAGFTMENKDKYKVLALADMSQKEEYIVNLWYSGNVPRNIIKYYKRKRVFASEVEKYENLKKQCIELINQGNDAKKVDEYYQKNLELYELEIREKALHLRSLRNHEEGYGGEEMLERILNLREQISLLNMGKIAFSSDTRKFNRKPLPKQQKSTKEYNKVVILDVRHRKSIDKSLATKKPKAKKISKANSIK